MNIDNINYPAPKQEYKVLVRCFTYNQSKYIEDALNGFAMQQTNFPFICLVMDDASTDGEQEVIKGWMERECDMNNAETIDIPTSLVIIVPHKTNTSCTFAFYLLKQNLYGTCDKKMNHVYPWSEKCKYEALCEGDDYWIDSLKLQKQVDILDANKNIGVCYTRAKVFFQNINSYSTEIGGEKFKGFKSQLLREPIMTLTSIYRVDLYTQYVREIEPHKKEWLMGDTPMWLWFSMNSQIYFLEDITAVYRVLSTSASHSSNYLKQFEYHKSLLDIRLFFVDKYCADDKLIIKQIYNDFHRRNMRIALKTKKLREYYKECKSLSDSTIKDYFRPLFYYYKY